MSKKYHKAPIPANLLFKNLFGECAPDESFERVASGLSAIRRNAERLLSDARFLVGSERFSSARFLLTTAREEIAKSYILVDMCRLHLENHGSVLRRLCKAFYDHISKHAYLKVCEFPNINSMSDVRTIWENETQRSWPGSIENGEPDMPHDTVFNREFPLYIDYGDYDQEWLLPSDSDEAFYFTEMFGKTPISETEKLIEEWRKADSIGVCSPKILAILNAVFKEYYIRENTTREQLVRLYEQVAEHVMRETGIQREAFMDSPFVHWPLYHFVCEG
ncbi:MAG: AbiV family abortive infection protein [Gammaproteobacteria bacterium]|nr:AbiV family abortive infection protein [Gammaproteobacteria bacterium]